MEELEKELKKTIEELVEKKQISRIELEGPQVVIVTKNPAYFYENQDTIGKIASKVKKKVVIRGEKNVLLPPEETKNKIKEIVPEEAGISNILFSEAFGKVLIEAEKPGVVIGKQGKVSKEIIRETNWIPEILRKPTSESKILTGIRFFLARNSKEIKKNYSRFSLKIYRPKKNRKNWVRVTALGGFREVGRSAILLETVNSTVLLDCGLHPSPQTKEDLFPHLESIKFPLDEIDAVVVSHAHLDHSACVPYLYKLGYTGPTYCTEPTRDLMALLHFDLINISLKDSDEPIYTEKDVKTMLKHCITREYNEVTDIAPDIRITFHSAAHILGSASVHVHVGEGEHNLLYSGDIQFGPTRLFDPLKINYPRIETLIIESTYGGKNDVLPKRDEAEKKLVRIINETVEKGGNVLVPVFAVGRAQEVMLVLEHFYRKGELKAENVFIDGMAKEASAIHTAYPEYLKKSLQRRILSNDSPFTSELFKEVKKSRDDIIEDKGNVILAPSGMLSGGPSLEYFYKMAGDEKNAIVFVGYNAEGSLGRRIQNGLKIVPYKADNGKTKAIEVKMRVETAEGFSGHADRKRLSAYLKNINPKPKKVLVNHGDPEKIANFTSYINTKLSLRAKAIRNLEAVRLR